MTLPKFPTGFILASSLLLAASDGIPANAQLAERNVSPGIRLSSDMGAVNPSAQINVTVHLKLNDEVGFDRAVYALYQPGSPTFHKWMTGDDLKKYAPSEAQQLAVRNELVRNGLTILSVDPNGLSIRARGSVANVARTFNTEIHQFNHNGNLFRANTTDARLSGEAANYVASVSGIETHRAHYNLVRSTDLRTGKPRLAVSAVSLTAGQLAAMSTTKCLLPAASHLLKFANGVPYAFYTGNGFDPLCGYLPSQLQAVYNLPEAYKSGFDGTGETIAVIEAFGSANIKEDANKFSKLTGLPKLDASNFKIIYPQGIPDPAIGTLIGADTETSLDVEWVHAIAPGAKILLVVTTGLDSEDMQNAIHHVVAHGLANTITNSYTIDLDLVSGVLEQKSWTKVLEFAAAQGVAVNFASGDNGDNGLGEPVGASEVPADNPFVTAVGGTSILNKIGGKPGETFTTGWGTTVIALSEAHVVDDPPQPGAALLGGTAGPAFFGGSGGGESFFYAKPPWQQNLPGIGRQTPDVSALGDPLTGVPIIVTQLGQQKVLYYGGTSLSCPIFSAMWAIATQYNGGAIGLAAPTIAFLGEAHSPFIQDVLPTSPATPNNVHGFIIDSHATSYSAAALFSGFLDGNTGFTSAFANFGGGYNLDVGFGLDTSLTVTPGWDNVTGYGTPNVTTMPNFNQLQLQQ